MDITATYDDDTKRMHRFIIDEGQGITGTIYVPKVTKEVPKTIVLLLRSRADRHTKPGTNGNV